MEGEWGSGIRLCQLNDEPSLSEEIVALLGEVEASPEPVDVVLDFAQVSYLNSSNLAQLLRLRAAIDHTGGRMKLSTLTEEVRSILTVSGLDKLFRFAPDVPTALAGLQLERAIAEGAEPEDIG